MRRRLNRSRNDQRHADNSYRTMRRFLVCIFFGVFAGAARGQPANVNRLLTRYDFDERRLGNVEDLPMQWTKVGGAGLPHYVNGRLSSDQAHSGRYSFRFDLNGGGLIYRCPAGNIRVQSGAHYRVDAFVRTTPLPNARARISAYFTDIDGHALPATRTHSELYAANNDDEPWKRLSTELTADAPGSAFLVIELELLQPMHYSETTLGQRALFDQDIHGSAWFDDVSVSQVPKVKLFTDRPGNIFSRSDPLRLQVLVNDRFTDDLAAQLVIRDATDKVVFQHTGGTVNIATAETLAPGQKRLTLALPELPPGWYEAALTMSSQGQSLGEQTIDLVRLAD